MKRLVLLGVAALLCVTALLAIGILLVGHFGHTEQNVLGTTLLLGGYGVVALPGALLLERRRLRALATASVAASAVAAALALVSIWVAVGDSVGKSVGTATFFALAGAQMSGLEAWTERKTRLVRRLFAASCATAVLLVLLLTTLVWTNPHGAFWARLAGALAVLDLLLVALQPVLSRAQPPPGRSLPA